MVWNSQDTIDEVLPNVDAVRSKPLKRRCSSRAGLSRYYSSKSQSFSSLDLVQCTQFGTSALALAKRPSSFDLRRGSPSMAGVRPAPSRLRADETCVSMTNEEDEDEGSTADRCPCNDTIFADPSDAFYSPDASPSASPLQNHNSCGLSSAAADIGAGASAASGPFAELQFQQEQHQQLLMQQQHHHHQQQQQPLQQQHLVLTTEYLSQLSSLLPFQQAFCGAPSFAPDRSRSSSSCCSSSAHSGYHTLSFSGVSTASSGSVAAAAAAASPAGYWQQTDLSPSMSMVLHLESPLFRGAAAPDRAGSLGPCGAMGAAGSAQPSQCTAATTARQIQSGCRVVGGPIGAAGSNGLCSQHSLASRSAWGRSCISAGGCADGAFPAGPHLHHPQQHQPQQPQQQPSMTAAASFPMTIRSAAAGAPDSSLVAPTPGSCGPSLSAAAVTAAAVAAAAAATGPAASSAHMRRLGLSARHKLRLSAAGRGAHQPGKPLWGSTEDLIASLSLTDKQHLQAGACRLAGVQTHGSAGAGAGTVMNGCGEARSTGAGHKGLQDQHQQQQQQAGHAPLPQSQLGMELRCWSAQHPLPPANSTPQQLLATGCSGSGSVAMEVGCGGGGGYPAATGQHWNSCGCGTHQPPLHTRPQPQSVWTHGSSAPTPALYGLLSGGF